MKKINLLLAASLLFTACNSKPSGTKENVKEDITKTTMTEDTTKIPLVGGDKDEHGCIASAGYTWSVLKKECIRIFEAGTRLNPTDAVTDKTTSAYAVFDSTRIKAEVFIPGQPGSVIMESGKKNPGSWINGDWQLGKAEKGLFLKKGSVILYSE